MVDPRVHHSSRMFNLSTALRQPWTGFTSWLFYLPVIALGVHPAVLAFCGAMRVFGSPGYGAQ
jgi:sterol desaturase/sphingolipid hydroxylase (fatty acid hydroxylase superfamily)